MADTPIPPLIVVITIAIRIVPKLLALDAVAMQAQGSCCGFCIWNDLCPSESHVNKHDFCKKALSDVDVTWSDYCCYGVVVRSTKSPPKLSGSCKM